MVVLRTNLTIQMVSFPAVSNYLDDDLSLLMDSPQRSIWQEKFVDTVKFRGEKAGQPTAFRSMTLSD